MKIKFKINEAIQKKPGLGSRRRREGPKFIVIHHAVCRSTTCTFNTLKQRGLSTHYEVDKDGSVLEYVTPGRWAFHAGGGFNDRSIGIDLTGLGGEATRAQTAALRVLVTKLCRMYSIPQTVAPDGIKFKNDEEIIEAGIGIVRHRNVKATACPGGFPMEVLGTVSDVDLGIEVTASSEEEKEKLSKKVRTGKGRADARHKKEMNKTGGRFLSKFRSFLTGHPDFTFQKFYAELDSKIEGGAEAALPKHGKDFVFGPEHMKAWNMLEKKK